MTKTLITNYAFNKTAKTVTFSDYATINLEGVLTVVNVTDGIIIYNPVDPAKLGTAATNVLTLAYDTSAMSNTDDLLIYYDDPAATQAITAAALPLPSGAATSTLQTTGNTVLSALDALLRQLNSAINRLGFLSTIVDTAGMLRVASVVISSLPTLANVTTVTTVTTVSTVTNQAQIGGFFANMNVMAQINQGVAEGIRANIIRS